MVLLPPQLLVQQLQPVTCAGQQNVMLDFSVQRKLHSGKLRLHGIPHALREYPQRLAHTVALQAACRLRKHKQCGPPVLQLVREALADLPGIEAFCTSNGHFSAVFGVVLGAPDGVGQHVVGFGERVEGQLGVGVGVLVCEQRTIERNIINKEDNYRRK